MEEGVKRTNELRTLERDSDLRVDLKGRRNRDSRPLFNSAWNRTTSTKSDEDDEKEEAQIRGEWDQRMDG